MLRLVYIVRLELYGILLECDHFSFKVSHLVSCKINEFRSKKKKIVTYYTIQTHNMGKKKTPVFRNGADNEANSTKDDKINAIRTWDDIEHDSEDDCRLIA